MDEEKWYESTRELPNALLELMGAERNGASEKEVKKIKKKIRKLIDNIGPELIGHIIGLEWLGASPEARRIIEEGVEALDDLHPVAAQMARYYIERAQLQERISADGVGILVI